MYVLPNRMELRRSQFEYVRGPAAIFTRARMMFARNKYFSFVLNHSSIPSFRPWGGPPALGHYIRPQKVLKTEIGHKMHGDDSHASTEKVLHRCASNS